MLIPPSQSSPAIDRSEPRAYWIRRHWAIVGVLILVAVFRSSLTTSGHLYWSDEQRYVHSVHALNHLLQGNFAESCQHIFDSAARPIFYVAYMLPAAAGKALVKLGLVEPDSPGFLNVFTLFNAAVSLVVAVLFYCLVWHFLSRPRREGDSELGGASPTDAAATVAAFWTLVYCLLCNSNLYVRHLLPYDLSLALFLWAGWLITRASSFAVVRVKTIVLCGVITALAYAAYPGYYPFVAIAAVFMWSMVANRWRATGGFVLVVTATLVLMELTSLAADRSFLLASRELSSTITQGSFEEGFVFLPRYLWRVEGAIGVLLLTLCACYLLFVCPRTPGPLRIIMVAVVGAYLLHATLGVVFHKLVFYGRLVHMHIPFVVLGAAMAVVCIPWRRVRLASYGCVGLACAFSFVTHVAPLWLLSYPRDFEQRQLAQVDAERLCIVDEINGPYDLEYDACGAVAVNVTSFPFGIPDFFFPVRLGWPWTLAAAAPHPRSHPAYRFEGSSVESRRNARMRGFEMRLYTRQSPESLAGR